MRFRSYRLSECCLSFSFSVQTYSMVSESGIRLSVVLLAKGRVYDFECTNHHEARCAHRQAKRLGLLFIPALGNEGDRLGLQRLLCALYFVEDVPVNVSNV